MFELSSDCVVFFPKKEQGKLFSWGKMCPALGQPKGSDWPEPVLGLANIEVVDISSTTTTSHVVSGDVLFHP
jgi:hypothetical protein